MRRTLHWRDWLAPRSFDAVVLVLYLGVVVNFLVQHAGEGASWQALVLVVGTLLLLALDRWEYVAFAEAPPRRLSLLLLALRLALIETIVQIEGFDMSAFLYVLLPLTASLSFGRRVGYWVSGVVWSVACIKAVLFASTQGSAISDIIVLTIVMLLLLTIAWIVLQERVDRQRAEHLYDEVERSHRQLAAYATQAVDLATATERNRIARDMHDSLGHYLTGLKIQLEKAATFWERDAAQSRAALDTSRLLAHESLDAVRQSIGMLRDDGVPFSLVNALEQLIAAAQSPGLTIGLQIEGDEQALPIVTRIALFRVAQEGLTNVQRHARAQVATVSLCMEPHQAALAVADDGIGGVAMSKQGEQQGRYGLQGIRERLELLDGTLQVESAPGKGTRLCARVPHPENRTPDGVAPLRKEARW